MGRISSLYLCCYNGMLAAAWCGLVRLPRHGLVALTLPLLRRARVFFLACVAVAVSGPGSTFAASGQLLFYAQVRAPGQRRPPGECLREPAGRRVFRSQRGPCRAGPAQARVCGSGGSPPLPQSAAVLEVFHALFGLVRSPWHVTAVQVCTCCRLVRPTRADGVPARALALDSSPRGASSSTRLTPSAAQVGSRIGVLWAVLWAIPEVQYEQVPLGRVELPGGAGVVELAVGPSTMIIAWSVSEVIRYTFYFCKARAASSPTAPSLTRTPPAGVRLRPGGGQVAAIQRLPGVVSDRHASRTGPAARRSSQQVHPSLLAHLRSQA